MDKKIFSSISKMKEIYQYTKDCKTGYQDFLTKATVKYRMLSPRFLLSLAMYTTCVYSGTTACDTLYNTTASYSMCHYKSYSWRCKNATNFTESYNCTYNHTIVGSLESHSYICINYGYMYYQYTSTLSNMFNSFSSTQFDMEINKIKILLKAFQKKRSKCMVYMLKTASKMACLACSGDSSNHFQNNTLKLNSNLCQNSLNNCFEFLNETIGMGQLDSEPFIQGMVDAFRLLKNKIDEGRNNPLTISIGLMNKRIFEVLMDFSTKVMNANNSIDTSVCTQNNCLDVFTPNGINISRIIKPNYQQNGSRRILSSSLSFSNSGYNVDSINSGAESSITFSEDPSGVNQQNNNANRYLIVIAIICLSIIMIII